MPPRTDDGVGEPGPVSQTSGGGSSVMSAGKADPVPAKAERPPTALQAALQKGGRLHDWAGRLTANMYGPGSSPTTTHLGQGLQELSRALASPGSSYLDDAGETMDERVLRLQGRLTANISPLLRLVLAASIGRSDLVASLREEALTEYARGADDYDGLFGDLLPREIAEEGRLLF